MNLTDRCYQVDGLPERSILYISINVAADHPMRAAVALTDPMPDMDLGRLTRLLGEGSRRYFCEKVIDATTEPLPEDLSAYCGLIIGCSAHSVNPADGPLLPWQVSVRNLVRAAIHDFNLPYLGICGGGQIGLNALGGQVGPNPAGVGFTPEHERSLLIGETTVELTQDGLDDPLFEGCPPVLGMTAIHSDYMQQIPQDNKFKVLAHSKLIPNQAIAYGDRVRLLGLHPEVTREFLDATVELLLDAGGFASLPRDQVNAAFDSISAEARFGKKVVDNFLKNFCAPFATRSQP